MALLLCSTGSMLRQPQRWGGRLRRDALCRDVGAFRAQSLRRRGSDLPKGDTSSQGDIPEELRHLPIFHLTNPGGYGSL